VVESRQTEAPVSREKDKCDSTLVEFSCFSCLNLLGFDTQFRTPEIKTSYGKQKENKVGQEVGYSRQEPQSF
jgi:hypothetical protein